ncbi:MAG TPA: hypothetical protein PKA37_09215, partial [Planctomycetota bacterium]|nr:hypothetical protein [Planctomycetota bacterium]
MSAPTHRLRSGNESHLITVARQGGKLLVSRDAGPVTEARVVYREGARVLLEIAGRQVEGFVRRQGTHVAVCFG